MAALLRRSPFGGINLGGVHRHGPVDGSVVERCSSIVSTVVGLGGVGQWGLDGGRMIMDARMEVVLSGTVVVSMAGLVSFMHGCLFRR
jgi:hypothetical protein